MDTKCIFCKILKGEMSGEINKVTDSWATLIPLEQVSKGHILVIPTSHYESILDLDNKEALKELGDVLRNTSKQQLKKFNADGINILNANKKAAQQSVDHLHFHIIPRYKDDKLNLWIEEQL